MLRVLTVLLITSVLCACQSSFQVRETLPASTAGQGETAPTADIPGVAPYVKTRLLSDVKSLADTLPTATTLVVFDIDDTLLSTPFVSNKSEERRFFGSDAWYNWQRGLPSDDPHAVPCIYDFLALNYEADTQPATEEAAGAIVKSISSDKLLLTSRSPDYRGGTERELKEVKILPIPQLTSDPNVFIRTLKGVPMTYINGIYMTKGADKGKALVALLERLEIDKKYSDVVLVDDGWKNIQNMYVSMRAENIRFHGFLYTRIKTDPAAGILDPSKVEPPRLSKHEVRVADRAWSRWLRALNKVYPERKERFDAKACTK
jgi:FMN phosphatase YigB (HAD superfamily)